MARQAASAIPYFRLCVVAVIGAPDGQPLRQIRGEGESGRVDARGGMITE
jgi:hypothetical protein